MNGRPRTVFVADEVLVDGKDKDLIDELVQRYGAQVVPRKPLPRPPEGMGPKDGVDVKGMPMPTLLRVSRAPEPSKRAAELMRASFSKSMSVTSNQAARLAGLVAELAADGKEVGLNSLSSTAALPFSAPTDWVPIDPLSVPAYNGSARVAAAWQLIEAFREFRSTKAVTVGILDSGFWLDGFVPGVSAGQPGSDFGPSVAQLNLMDEGVSAGGASGMMTSGGFTGPWHGNASASVATAKVGNGLGAAGVGGTVATPVLFKTDGSLDYYFRCLQLCLAWGLDVLNMSISHSEDAEFWFPTTAWNNNFQYAFDAGLIMVAAAGNDFARIPEDKNVRPATRTPGTITVGALDTPLNGVELPKDYSNYGSSVNVWAPTDIPVIPDENSQLGSSFGGTSAAAPFVSGIMAMMRAVAPIGTLSAARAKQLLEDSGWRGTGRVGIGVDAYAAVLAAMGGRLPDDEAESHATPQTARQLKVGPGGALMPFRLRSDPRRAALSSKLHSNWYKFETDTFSQFDLQLRFYSLLGAVSVTLEPDDGDSRANAEVATSVTPGFVHLVGLIAPGSYKIFVRGAINLYELEVRLTNAVLASDEFEPNDSFEVSTQFRLVDATDPSVIFRTLAHGAGSYDLTLHTPNDKDFFRIEPIAKNPLSVPMLRVTRSDLPLNITLFDAAHKVVGNEVGVRAAKLTLPRDEVSFVEIAGPRPTRYRLTLRLEVDPAHLPGPLEKQAAISLPDLGDPPFRVDDGMSHVIFNADAASRAGVLTLAAVEGQALRVELLDSTGAVLRTAKRRESFSLEAVEIDVKGLAPGDHVLRIGHADAGVRLGTTPLNVQLLPSFA
jgi:subtilase family protein